MKCEQLHYTMIPAAVCDVPPDALFLIEYSTIWSMLLYKLKSPLGDGIKINWRQKIQTER